MYAAWANSRMEDWQPPEDAPGDPSTFISIDDKKASAASENTKEKLDCDKYQLRQQRNIATSRVDAVEEEEQQPEEQQASAEAQPSDEEEKGQNYKNDVHQNEQRKISAMVDAKGREDDDDDEQGRETVAERQFKAEFDAGIPINEKDSHGEQDDEQYGDEERITETDDAYIHMADEHAHAEEDQHKKEEAEEELAAEASAASDNTKEKLDCDEYHFREQRNIATWSRDVVEEVQQQEEQQALGEAQPGNEENDKGQNYKNDVDQDQQWKISATVDVKGREEKSDDQGQESAAKRQFAAEFDAGRPINEKDNHGEQDYEQHCEEEGFTETDDVEIHMPDKDAQVEEDNQTQEASHEELTAEAVRRFGAKGITVNAFSPGLIADPNEFFRNQC